MKTIWNGFETTPHTLPDACAVCFGSVTGEFALLPCGHGGPEYDPIHIKCIIRSIDTEASPSCPMCRSSIDATTLLELVRYVRTRGTASFPDEYDQKREGRLYTSPEEASVLLEVLAGAYDRLEGAKPIQAVKEERKASYWNNILNDVDDFTKVVEVNIGQGRYHRDTLEKACDDVEAKMGRLISALGRLVFFRECMEVSLIGRVKLSYSDMYERFVKMGYRLERIDFFLREERKSLQILEKIGPYSVKRIWNGFDVDPPVKPEGCAVCSGERGGDFVILDCGHGQPGDAPIHVNCILENVQDCAKNGDFLTCPVCHDSVAAGTLSRLSDFIYRKGTVTYPGSDGSRQRDESYAGRYKKGPILEALETLQHTGATKEGGFPLRVGEVRAHYMHVIDEADHLIEHVNKTVSEHAYTPEDMDTDLHRLERVRDFMELSAGQIVEFGGVHFWNNRALEAVHNELSLTAERLARVSYRLRCEKNEVEAAHRADAEHPKKVWSGFESEPKTLPQDCLVCFGKYGGDFITLECGHGSPGTHPLHVGCVLEMSVNAVARQAEAQCPVCGTVIGRDSLACLIEYVRRNDDITFPGDDGQSKTVRLFDMSEDQKNVLAVLRQLQDAPSKSESSFRQGDTSPESSEHLADDMERFAEDVERNISERAYTLEGLEEVQNTIEGFMRQASTLYADSSSKESCEDAAMRFRSAENRLQAVQDHLRQEKEEMEHREKAHT